MIHPDLAEDSRLLIRTCQIIVLSMAAGAVMFLGIIAIGRSDTPAAEIAPPPAKSNLQKNEVSVNTPPGELPELVPASARLTYVLLAALVPILVARVIVPQLYVATVVRHIIQGEEFVKFSPSSTASISEWLARKHGFAGLLAQAFLTKTILTAALLEGAAMIAILAYYLQGETVALVAAVILIILLLLLWPTTGRFLSWVGEELHKIEEHRQFDLDHAREDEAA